MSPPPLKKEHMEVMTNMEFITDETQRRIEQGATRSSTIRSVPPPTIQPPLSKEKPEAQEAKSNFIDLGLLFVILIVGYLVFGPK